MHTLFTPLAAICVSFALGIGIQPYLNVSLANLLVFFGIFIGLLLGVYFIVKQRRLKGQLFLLVSCLCLTTLGAFCYYGHQEIRATDHYLHRPKLWQGVHQIRIDQSMRSTAYSDRYLAQISSLNGHASSGQILFSIYKDSLCKPLTPGEHLLITGTLKQIDPPTNPHQFNYRAYLGNQQVYGQLSGSYKNVIEYFETKHSLFTLAQVLRNKLGQLLRNSGLSDNSTALSSALLLGDKKQLNRPLYEAFADAGVVHLLAVSGLHVGILYWILLGSLRPLCGLGIKRSHLQLLAIVILWGYALLTGLSPSVVRAVFMFSLIGLAGMTNRSGNSLNALFTALLFLLLARPNWLFEIGFQLSFVAVFFILWLHPILVAWWNPSFWLLKTIRDLIGVSLIAQLGVAPLCLLYFHQFPGLFLVANLALLPCMSVLLSIGLLVLLCLLLSINIAWLIKLYDGLLQLMVSWVEWVAAQSDFLLQHISFNQLEVWTFYAALAGLLFWIKNRNSKSTTLMVLGGLSFLLAQFHYTLLLPKDQLVVFHLRGKSLLGVIEKDRLKSYSYTTTSYTEQLLSSFAVGDRLIYCEPKQLDHVVAIGNKVLLVVDRRGYFPNQKVDMVLLRADSKVALDRLLLQTKPELVIADGSNYGKQINRWKASCRAAGIPFYNTAIDGALRWNQSMNSP